MLRWLVEIRRRSGGQIAQVARRLRVHGPLLRLYDLALSGMTSSGQSTTTVDVDGHAVRFRLTSRAEAKVLIDHWEMPHIRMLKARIQEGDVLWDVGANVGLFACCLGAASGTDFTVHAFEPIPLNARRLAENVELNGLNNVMVHEVALSDERGQFTMYTQDLVGTPRSSLFAHHASAGSNEVTVEVYPPVEFAREQGLAPPTLVKCDVEGAEAAVLRGLHPWLEDGSIRILFVEYHPATLAEHGESVEALDAYVTGFGFRAFDRIARGDASRPSEVAYERIE